ncbi:recombinase family protein [Mycobacteroides chelonae]|uniref:recombinase family protein n=1 Tax=Mycobacteroides chelonae TaxID=1774 RepID=UPI000993715E|nr:recombinase family protein [Mycobacteroides chelonae]
MTTVTYNRAARPSSKEIAGQQALCRDLCLQRGWEIATEYVDNGYGAFVRRPAFEAMIKAIESGQIKRVVIDAAYRISRSLADMNTFLDLTETHGVEVAIAQQSLNSR